MQRFDKYTVQTLGFALIVIGILLFMIGLLAGPQQGVACPVSGCPPTPLPWYWWIPSASFFSGIGLTIAGIILLIVAHSMKPKRKTDAANTQTPEDE
jgi:hypothetical protein